MKRTPEEATQTTVLEFRYGDLGNGGAGPSISHGSGGKVRERVREAKSEWRDVAWIAELAEPYVRGYVPRRERGAGLEGFWFGAAAAEEGKRKKGKEEKKAN